MHDVARGQREGDAGLLEVVADGDLAAEGVAAAGDAEGVKVVGVGLNEDRDVQTGEFDRVGDAFFVAEVGEDDQNAVDLVAVAAKRSAHFAGIGVGFDAAELGLLRREHDGLDTCGLEEGKDVLACFADEDIREEIAVADDDAEGDGGVAGGHVSKAPSEFCRRRLRVGTLILRRRFVAIGILGSV